MASSIDYNMASTFARKTVRTMEDGPTTKQKVMVSFIWIGSAFFGIATCFPDKVFGVALSQKIKEDQGGDGANISTDETTIYSAIHPLCHKGLKMRI